MNVLRKIGTILLTTFLAGVSFLIFYTCYFVIVGLLKPNVKLSWALITSPSSVYRKDQLQDMVFTPSISYMNQVAVNGVQLYSIRYDLDQFSLRKINRAASFEKPNKHLILAGCSFVFGQGLENKDTLIQIVENSLEKTRVYPLAWPGGGLHTAFWFMDSYDLNRVVEEKSGTFIYVLLEDHINRFLLRPQYLAWAMAETPAYTEINGSVVHLGKTGELKSFRKIQFLGKYHVKSLLISLFSKLNLIRYPNGFSDSDLDRFVVGLGELQRRYLHKFPRGKFAVLFYPDTNATSVSALLKKKMQLKAIEILDPRSSYDEFVQKRHLSYDDLTFGRYDGHPRPLLSHFLANWMVRMLK